MSEQQNNLDRAYYRIAAAVRAFVVQRGVNGKFYADDLRRYVRTFVGEIAVAPSTPDRVLRDLRQRGLIDYHVISRGGSLYRITRIEPIFDDDTPEQGDLFSCPKPKTEF